MRIPIVPGSDPRLAYGDLHSRGVRGVILEAFGVGNMPDKPEHGWLSWLKDQRRKGLQVGGMEMQVHMPCEGFQLCFWWSGGQGGALYYSELIGTGLHWPCAARPGVPGHHIKGVYHSSSAGARLEQAMKSPPWCYLARMVL